MAMIPSSASPVLDQGGGFTSPWYRFFSDLIGNPEAIRPIAPTGSPFTFTAPRRGFLQVFGPAPSNVTLTRGRVSIPVALTSDFIPVSAGDEVRISYSSAPTLNFIPA